MTKPVSLVILALMLLGGLAASAPAPRGAPPALRGAVPPPIPPKPVALVQPNGLALAPDGRLFITDLGTHRLLKLDPHGVLTPVAGTGEGGFNGDGLPAAKARLFAPHDVALDSSGNILVADTYNHRIRRIDRQGLITTVAGNGTGAYTGDGGPASKASLNNPQGLAVTSDGTLFIADTYNHVVRRVDPKGLITTFAGTAAGLAGDGGPANHAQISLPTAVAVAPDGSVYIADSGNNRIRRVKPDGIIETVLGTGPGNGTAGAGFSGDGGPVLQAKIFGPTDLDLTLSGDLLLADSGNHRIRRVSNGIITTLAGAGLSADGGASLNAPQKIAVAPNGSLYVADSAAGRVWRVDGMGHLGAVQVR